MHLNIYFFLLCGELAKNVLFWRFLKHILKNNLVKSSVWESTYLSTNPYRSVMSSRRQIKVNYLYITSSIFWQGYPSPFAMNLLFKIRIITQNDWRKRKCFLDSPHFYRIWNTQNETGLYSKRNLIQYYFFDNVHEIIDR